MPLPCNQGIIIPILESDQCQGSTTKASCVRDSSLYSELNLPANATQQQINLAFYNTVRSLKERIETLENI